MVTSTLNGTPGDYNWDDPSAWVGGVVPNGAGADVVFPVVTLTSTGQPVGSEVTLGAAESYNIRSLAVNDDSLNLGGTLAISGALTFAPTGSLLDNGILSIGSLSNSGTIQTYGQSTTIMSSGAMINSGAIGTARLDPNLFTPAPTNITLTLTSSSFSNTGTLAGVLVETAAGGFTNLQNGALSGGTYVDIGVNVGATIVTDAANLSLFFDPTAASYMAGPADEELDPATGTYVPIESTLRTIAAGGSLTTGRSYTTSSLTVDGVLTAAAGGTLTANQLTIDAGGRANISGTFVGSITDNGVIKIAPYILYNPVYDTTVLSLVIDGPVAGDGSLEITAGPGGQDTDGPTLELKAATSSNVVFDNQRGSLSLDQPNSFTGTIKPAGAGDTITLAGIALGSITSQAYVGDASGGTLTLTEANGTRLAYRFVGGLTQDSFVLSAGPQPYSTSPPSLIITVNTPEQTGNAFYIDGRQGVQNLVGTGNPSFINTTNAAGAGNVVVDLQEGDVTKGGQTDAILTNIQGVQLGSDTSEVIGSASGTDLIYDGSGTDTIQGSFATQIIQGGTGTTLVYGTNGNEIVYGNGGTDVVRASSGDNFLSGGSTATSADVLYGTGGNDFVYGHGGAVDLVGGGGNEFLSAGSGFNELDDRQAPPTSASPVSELVGSTGVDLFYGGVGTNLIDEGSGTDTFVGSSGMDSVYGGSGRSFTYAGSGTDVVTTGAGDDYVKAGTGSLTFNDTAANQTAGRYDEIDNFAGSKSTDLYLPTTAQNATTFTSQNGGTAIMTGVSGGSAEVFVAGASIASVQAHTHFTLTT